METSSPSSPVRAEVLAAGMRAPYLRAGTGHPVVVLVPAAGLVRGRTAVAERLAECLAGRCRIIVPETPPDAARLDEWLRAFIDGLGVSGVGLVVAASLADAARSFVAREPERVARLVVLGDSDAALPEGADTLAGLAEELRRE